MDPEVQKALLKLVEEAKGLAAQEIPFVLKDLLTQGIVENSVLFFVGLLGIPLLWMLFRHVRAIQELEDTWASDKGFKTFITSVGIGIVGLATVLCIGGSITNILTIWLAPRAYLLGLLK